MRRSEGSESAHTDDLLDSEVHFRVHNARSPNISSAPFHQLTISLSRDSRQPMPISSRSRNESEPLLRIGEVARRSGLTVEALRYYERVGLLPAATRSSGGFRQYSPDVVAVVGFIKRVQALGLSLEEIRQLTRMSQERPRQSCQHVRDMLARHIADIDQRLDSLQALRDTLEDYRRSCQVALQQSEETRCPSLDAWELASR